jgi:hypothetical protein
VVKENRRLTAALTYITAAGIDHPATTGIDHLETAAVIRNGAVTAVRLLLSVGFTGI